MEVKRSVGDITERVLTQALRRLERDGYVSREVHPTSPPTVEYWLTPMGESLLKPMGKLVQWANVHFREVADHGGGLPGLAGVGRAQHQRAGAPCLCLVLR